MVDYNQSLSVPEAMGRVQLLEDEALVWVEGRPVPTISPVTPELPPSAALPFR